MVQSYLVVCVLAVKLHKKFSAAEASAPWGGKMHSVAGQLNLKAAFKVLH